MTPAELKVEKHFEETHLYLPSENRYLVRLPKVDEDATLGESKTAAVNRARGNEKSLIRKNKLQEFQNVMQEYVDLGHAQPVTHQMVQLKEDSYYMPVHAVFKESSSTTKVRAVFDASAKSTNKKSLNDLLAVGPTLHPAIDHILLNFRVYVVAITGDITKMYREVLLHPKDRTLHRFVWKPDGAENWSEFQMTRVTFSVAASPYLAVKVLQKTATDFGSKLPKAQWHLLNSFYVDDLMGGANSEKEAVTLYHDLCNILANSSFQLKKWRSSSKKVLKEIPVEIQEKLPTQSVVDKHSASYPKALGVAWDSRADTMSISVSLEESYDSTKRGVISDVAKTFDVLGWISPAILPMKLLYREI